MISPHEVLEGACITFVFSRGTIFRRVRESGPAVWRALAGCPLCVGVWIGMALYVARSLGAGRPLDALCQGAMTGTLAIAIYGLVRRI